MGGRDGVHPTAIDGRTGWVVAGLGLLLLTILWGAVFTYTVYARELAATFGVTALQTSVVVSVGSAAFFVVGGSVGILTPRVPYRPVMAGAAVGVVRSVGLLQVADSFTWLALAFSLFGVPAGSTFVLSLSRVPQWFDSYEGLAVGVVVAGNGVGIQVMPFVWLWLLDRTTIRWAFLVVGVAAVLVLVVAAFVFRRPPGASPTASTPVDVTWLRSLLGDPRFIAAWTGLVIAWSWYFVLSSGLVDILVSAGIARSIAVPAFGLVGGISVVTRVASGGLGAIAALYAPIVVWAFDPENATAVTGVFTFCSATAGYPAPVAVNALASTTGGYATPLVALGALTVLGAGLFYWGTGTAAGA